MAISQNLTVSLQSQSVVDNTSVVKIRWTSTQDGKSFNANTRTAYYYVSINGGAETRYSASYTLPQNSTRVVVDTNITVPHRADGTASIKVRTWMDTKISAGVVTRTRDLTLPTIARATTPTLSATSVTLGNSVTINLPRASSTFTHTVQYKVGSMSAYTVIQEGATTSTTFTPSINIASALPNSTSGKCSIKVYTYDGTKFIGERIISDLTLLVPTSIVPTITQSLKPVNGLPLSAPTKYIQSKSSISVNVGGSGSYESTIKSRQTTIKYGSSVIQSSSLASFTSSVIGRTGTIIVESIVTDSRGRSATKTTNLTFEAYNNPKLTNVSVFRSNSSGAIQDDGAYIRINATPVISSIGGSNTGTITARYRQAGVSTWTTAESKTGTAFGAIVKTSPATTEKEFEVEIEINDEFNKSPNGVKTAYRIGSAFALIDFHKDGKGIAIGKVSNQGELIDIADDFKMIGGAPVSLTATDNLDNIKRVGRYMQTRSADASTTKNYPVSDAGHLVVTGKDSPKYNMILQEYHQYNTANTWRRTCYNNSWTSWYKIAYTKDVPPAPTTVDFSSQLSVSSGVTGQYAYERDKICTVGFTFKPTEAGFTTAVVTVPSNYHPVNRIVGQVDFASSTDIQNANVSTYMTTDGKIGIVARPVPTSNVYFSFTYIAK